MPAYRYGKSYPHDAGAPSVAVENISVQYNGHKALDGITLDYIAAEMEKLKALGSTYTVAKGMGGK